MTQHPGQDEPSEGEDQNPGQRREQTPEDADSPGHQPTRPLGAAPNEPGVPGRPPGQSPNPPGTVPGQPEAGRYGQPAPPHQQAPGAGPSGYGPSGYGYGQQQSGYPGPNQPNQPGQPGQGPGQGQPGPAGQQYPGQYPGQPYQQPYPQSQGAPTKHRSPEGKNFFAALFDFSFQSFVAVKFAKFIYAILIAFIALGYLVVVIAAFSDGAAEGMIVLLLGWIPAAIYLILIRISLEFMIALVRTSQNTAGTRSEIEALRSELKNSR